MHTVYYVLIFSYLVLDLALIFYAYKLKKQVSRFILLLLFVPIPISMIGFIINHFTMNYGYEVVHITYVLAQVVYLFIVHRIAISNCSRRCVWRSATFLQAISLIYPSLR